MRIETPGWYVFDPSFYNFAFSDVLRFRFSKLDLNSSHGSTQTQAKQQHYQPAHQQTFGTGPDVNPAAEACTWLVVYIFVDFAGASVFILYRIDRESVFFFPIPFMMQDNA